MLEYKNSEASTSGQDRLSETVVEVFLNDVSPDVFAAVVAYIYQDDALVRHSTNVTFELITSRVDAVVRTLAFHQCSLSSIPSSLPCADGVY